MMNWYRFGSLPHSLKIITFFGTLLVMIAMSSAVYQRAGIGLVWSTSLFALISNIAMILIIVLEIEVLLTPPKLRMISWNFMEACYSIIFAVLFFISVFICINASTFGSTTAFSVAGFFCFCNFMVYLFSIVYNMQQWMREMRIGKFYIKFWFKNVSFCQCFFGNFNNYS